MLKIIKNNIPYICSAVILILIPIICIDSNIIRKIYKSLYNNVDFWIGYMTYAGALILGGVSLIQNKRLHG